MQQRVTSHTLLEQLEEFPVIAAVKSEAGLEKCLTCESRAVFVLYGDLVSIGGIAARIHEAGKAAIVHIDLIDGLSPREVAVDFIRTATAADGIISTRPALVGYARQSGLIAVQRFFVLDSLALQNVRKILAGDSADLIEILPGAMPKVISRIAASTSRPIIAGGLISDKEDVLCALGAGAVAISSTNEKVWFM